MKAYVLCGCSASGKTTFAKELEAQGWIDINRDDIRFNQFCNGVRDWSLYKFTKERENQVTKEQEFLATNASLMKKNVIISDTNINDNTRNKWVDLLTKLGYEVEIKYFDVDLMELLERDAKRPNGVGYKVITDQYTRYMKLRHGEAYHQHVAGRKHCILADIDGTLADMEGVRKPYDWHLVHLDKPRNHIIDIVENYRFDKGTDVIFVSGRDAVCQAATRQWLINYVGEWTEDCLLLMRPQGDMRKDTVVKKEIFDTYIKGRYNVDYAIDDRNAVIRMWTYELGLEVLQVGKIHNEF